MGFCIFGNVAVAARHAQAELGLERVAILDWDVHHGNGTQDIFWDDPTRALRLAPPVAVLSGQRRAGRADGYDRERAACPPGSGDEEYLRAFDHIVAPALDRFDPDLVIVSAGFDAHEDDPLAGMRGDGRRVPGARPRARPRWRLASPPCSRAATTWRRCRGSSVPRSRASEGADRASTSARSTPASIGHVHLKVADIDRSLDFYCGVLGFELMTRFGDQAAFISAGGYHHHIGLNTWESKGGPPPPPGTTGLYHVAIRYPSRAALADALRRLVEAGIPLDGASDHGVSEALYLRDPDGNGVELYRDRPRDEWPRDENGGLTMYTRPADLQGILDEAENYVPV